MELFFRITPKGMREYQWTNDRWKRLEVGHYAAALLDEFLRYDDSKGPPPSSLVEMTGLSAEQDIVAHVWPLCIMALYLAAGRRWRDMEILPRREDAELEVYLNNTRPELWSVWHRIELLPFYAGLSRSNAFGWWARAETALEAAAAELVLTFMHGVKRPFRFCEKHMVFYHTECPHCRPEAEARKRFFGLLRQYKYRIMRNILPLEEEVREYVLGEIAEIQVFARKGRALRPLIERYREVCRENGLPTDWAANYRPFLEGR